MTTNPAKAFKLVDRTDLTDIEFNNLIRNGEFSELFVAEGRIGNNSINTAERELSINGPLTPTASGQLIGGEPIVTEEFVWGNGQEFDFNLEYTGQVVNYTVGNQLLSSTSLTGDATDIFLRTRATTDSSMTLTQLVLEGQEIGSLSSSVTGSGSDVDYLQISEISTPFQLAGKVSMSWTGEQPLRSNLAYQLKVGNSPPTQKTPEPGTAGAMFVSSIVGLGWLWGRISK
ncbi:MAG: PEP-CTERM sorting domain-containing protein [Nostocaceae cyanobacterium]|nr:PEP-CTERM sorting domain-containing protein [Nostocaceae cyanobacterium]